MTDTKEERIRWLEARVALLEKPMLLVINQPSTGKLVILPADDSIRWIPDDPTSGFATNGTASLLRGNYLFYAPDKEARK
ncbi:MAG: hypothetical protein ABIH03_06555 [Pseudomonadota bacterium]